MASWWRIAFGFVDRSKWRLMRRIQSFMNLKRISILGTILVCAAAAVPVHAQTELRKVLAQMDAASAKFQSAQADFEWTDFEAAVQQSDVQSGTIYFERKAGQLRVAAMISKPQPKQAIYADGKVQYYEPGIDHLTVVSAGQNRTQADSFSNLGFGGSGTELEKNWKITYLGHEKVGDADTVKLDLVSKQPNNMYSHITLWLDPVEDVSLKQQAFEPSGDYRTAVYTNRRVNQKIPANVFTIKTTKKTTIVNR
jgi:outer membrane lipoprotein-sorting protein